MDENKVEIFAYQLLSQLPPFLFYHSKKHTEYVVSKALYLCGKEGVYKQETSLIKMAALLHDTGFTVKPDGENHEEESCIFAAEILPQAGYSDEQVKAVCRLILSTRMPQLPVTLPEQILCDADLFYLGTDQYSLVSRLLYKELLAQQKAGDKRQWIEKQIQFLSSHHYFTTTATEQLEACKQTHLQALIKAQQTTL